MLLLLSCGGYLANVQPIWVGNNTAKCTITRRIAPVGRTCGMTETKVSKLTSAGLLLLGMARADKHTPGFYSNFWLPTFWGLKRYYLVAILQTNSTSCYFQYSSYLPVPPYWNKGESSDTNNSETHTEGWASTNTPTVVFELEPGFIATNQEIDMLYL